MFDFLHRLTLKRRDEHSCINDVGPELAAVPASSATSVIAAPPSGSTAALPEFAAAEPERSVLLFAPPGHFYSPVVDPVTLQDKAEQLWRNDKPVLGVDFNDSNHVDILKEVFPRHIAAYDYPDELPESAELTRYFTNNTEFAWLDSRALLVLLLHLRPARIVEIGSGFSSLLTADVNNRLLHNSARFSCIEPYPREFLRKPLPGLHELLVCKVEELPASYFAELAAGDVLFIDSSHVAKTGSDVNYLVFEILPRLQPGVIVHIHDIFLPAEYPRHWVVDENRSWNEQYVIRALLMHSTAFRVYFGCNYAFVRYPELVAAALGGQALGGSSLWLERI